MYVCMYSIMYVHTPYERTRYDTTLDLDSEYDLNC